MEQLTGHWSRPTPVRAGTISINTCCCRAISVPRLLTPMEQHHLRPLQRIVVAQERRPHFTGQLTRIRFGFQRSTTKSSNQRMVSSRLTSLILRHQSSELESSSMSWGGHRCITAPLDRQPQGQRSTSTSRTMQATGRLSPRSTQRHSNTRFIRRQSRM